MQITPDIEKLIDLAIMEDYSMGDATTDALIPTKITGTATVVADEHGTIAVSYTHLTLPTILLV